MNNTVLSLLVALACVCHASSNRINVVLLGATGNLAQKYLWQGLYNIDQRGLDDRSQLYVFPAATKPAEISAPLLREVLEHNITETGAAGSKAAFISSRVHVYSQLRNPEQYEQLGIDMEASLGDEKEVGRLIYLSVPPKFFGNIARQINAHLRPKSDGAWLQVVIEKPFGVNLETALALAQDLERSLKQTEILLVDHYMGKEALRVLPSFRRSNPDIDGLFNDDNVARIEVAMLETEHLEKRTDFYDDVGVIRDVMQNHLMMMLSLVTMELGENAAADLENRLELFRAIKSVGIGSVQRLGQYQEYNVHREQDIKRWNPDAKVDKVASSTPTFARINLHIANARWNQTKVVFVAGKALATRKSYVTLVFKDASRLEVSVQGINYEGGVPDKAAAIYTTKTSPEITNIPAGWFKAEHPSSKQGQLFGYSPEYSAYESLLFDALQGRVESFVQLSEVLESWRVWTTLLDDTSSSDRTSEACLAQYPLGSYAIGSSPEEV